MPKVSIAESSFTGSKVSKLPLFLPPIPVAGATYAWDARSLGGVVAVNDPVNTWDSYIGTATMTPAGSNITGATAPVLVSDSGRLGVKFTATSLQSIGTALSMGQPHTLVAYGRDHIAPSALAAIVGAGSGGSAPVLGETSTGARTYAGTTLSMASSTDLLPHVWVSVFNGASSVIRRSGVEVIGNAGSNTRTYISVGGYATSFSNLVIYKFALFPAALDLTQRGTLDGFTA